MYVHALEHALYMCILQSLCFKGTFIKSPLGFNIQQSNKNEYYAKNKKRSNYIEI